VFHHQLPVYSPLSARAVAAAFGRADERAPLAAHLRAAYDVPRVVLTDSGTSALTLAIRAAALRRPGAPVALPAYGCFDLATAAIGAGVRVVLYDVQAATLTPDLASVERALARGVCALVVAHFYGVPVPMDAMQAAADRAGALLIEDAAQGAGGSWRSRPLGATAPLGVLSFGRGKGITGGGGGALLGRDAAALPDAVVANIRPADEGDAVFGAKLAAQWALGRPALYALPARLPMLQLGETLYHAPTPVRGLRTASARILLHTMPLAQSEAQVRRTHAARLIRSLGERRDGVVPAIADGGEAGWLRLPVHGHARAAAGEGTDVLGIMPGYPYPLNDLAMLQPHLDNGGETFAGARELTQRLWTLPTHSHLGDRDLGALASWLERHAA
jgi:dTDP-4-amino-4,6-dideoxygalactose transaminase